MKNQQLKLKTLKIESFVTSKTLNVETVKGGTDLYTASDNRVCINLNDSRLCASQVTQDLTCSITASPIITTRTPGLCR